MDLLLRSSIFLLIIMFLSPKTLSMRYEIHSGQMKCISEDIHPKSMTVGKYFIVNPNDDHHPLPASHKIIVNVMSPQGTMLHEAENVESGQFSFTASETGTYLACITAVNHKPETTLTIDFDWRSGVHFKDWSNVVKKSQVEMMESSVKSLLDTIVSIHEEMYFLHERGEEMHELTRSTNSKMALLSFLSLGVCLSVAGFQFWHLKTFFEKRKLI
ncbi:transmembrane emp24 domain-containing protein p24delta8 [Raphanus sativus]|uniref:Transmembrane emp24 domain-containing protein p24delta8 n=1 Tax=Raphanus sativus TaxID=3726 RepID=A0A6J0ND22_RAPSA|nr:transmembrane emp24 domain-containing protein p24delta8 [Raphanus sativus]